MMKQLLTFVCLITTWSRLVAKNVGSWQLRSPDNAHEIYIVHREASDGKRQLYYSADYRGKEVIRESELGVLLENQLFESALGIENDPSDLWCENLAFSGEVRNEVKADWEPVYGERAVVGNRYRELVLKFTKFGDAAGLSEGQHGTSYDKRRSYELHLVFRAYNEGIAFK